MAYEGTPTNIPIKGIERAGSNFNVEDGAMNEAIGLRYKDGSFVPYTPEISRCKIQGFIPTMIRVHKTSFGQENVIAVTGQDGSYVIRFMDKRTFDASPTELSAWTKIADCGDVYDISFVGNIMCVATSDGVLYFVFTTDGTYKAKPDLLGKLPKLIFRVTNDSVDSKTKEHRVGKMYIDSNMGTLDLDKPDTIRDAMITKWQHVTGVARDEGMLTGAVMAVYAYRLSNGDFMYASMPVYLCEPQNKRSDGFAGQLLWDVEDSEADSERTHLYEKFGDNAYIGPHPDERDSVVNKGFAFVPEFNNKKTLYENLTEWMKDKTSDRNLVESEDRWNVYSDLSEDESDTGASAITYYYKKLYNDLVLKSPTSFVTVTDHYEQVTAGSKDETNNAVSIACALGNSLQYQILSNLDSDLAREITSVCVFISPEIRMHSTESFKMSCIKTFSDMKSASGSTISDVVEWTYSLLPRLLTRDEFEEEFNKITGFYKVMELFSNEIKQSDDWETVDLKGKLGDNLLVRELLPSSVFDASLYKPQGISTYNGSLLMFNYDQQLRYSCDIGDYFYHSGEGQIVAQEATFNVKHQMLANIKTPNSEERTIVQYTNNYERLVAATDKRVPMVIFPDSYADSVTFSLYGTHGYTGATKYIHHGREYNLVHHKYLNISYYYTTLSPEDVWDNREVVEPTYPTTPEKNSIIKYTNGLKASDTYFPNIFPKKNSYTIGDEAIVAIGRFNIPISNYAYGKYPLLVMCTDGTYSFDIVNGYVTPNSREICINKNSVCELDGMVIFATDKGLVRATPEGLQIISEKLHGKPNPLPNAYEEKSKGLNLYYRAITNEKIVDLGFRGFPQNTFGQISKEDFFAYIRDNNTHVSYASEINSLLVYNDNFEYCYLMDINTTSTTKLGVRIGLSNNDHSDEEYYVRYGSKSGNGFKFSHESNIDATDCLLQSRPIKVTMGLKDSYRVVVRGRFKGESGTRNKKWAELIILGSLDGDHWQPMAHNGKELVRDGFHDIGAVVHRNTCNYIMVILAGCFSPDSTVDMIQITNRTFYNNKLK